MIYIKHTLASWHSPWCTAHGTLHKRAARRLCSSCLHDTAIIGDCPYCGNYDIVKPCHPNGQPANKMRYTLADDCIAHRYTHAVQCHKGRQAFCTISEWVLALDKWYSHVAEVLSPYCEDGLVIDFFHAGISETLFEFLRDSTRYGVLDGKISKRRSLSSSTQGREYDKFWKVVEIVCAGLDAELSMWDFAKGEIMEK